MEYELHFRQSRLKRGLVRILTVQADSLPRVGEKIILRRTRLEEERGKYTFDEKNNDEIEGRVYEVIRNVHQNYTVIDNSSDPPVRTHYYAKYNDNAQHSGENRRPIVKVLIKKK